MSADDDGPARRVLLIGLGLLVGGLVVVTVITSSRGVDRGTPRPLVASAAEPSGSASATPSPTAGAGDATPAPPSPRPTSRPAPSADAPDDLGGTSERSPTSADAARFSTSYSPPGASQIDTVTVDLEGDGTDEVVVASVVGDVSRVDVARWDGSAYEVTFTGRGGAVERLVDLRVVDVTDDGLREIWVRERSGERGESISMWGLVDGDLQPLRASGGCADGRHTYGVIGAQVRRGQITATCDGSPLPPEVWPTDTYRWSTTGWVAVDEEEPSDVPAVR